MYIYVCVYVCIYICIYMDGDWDFPGGTSGKESTCKYRGCKRCSFDPWVGKIPCRRKWQPTPVFMPGESHRQRSLAGYSPRGCKELVMTEWLSIWGGFSPWWKGRALGGGDLFALGFIVVWQDELSRDVMLSFDDKNMRLGQWCWEAGLLLSRFSRVRLCATP